MNVAALDGLPGFRRRFRITPQPGVVSAALEDDFHAMDVTIRHADGVARRIESRMHRAPWTTCPGAVQQLVQTFAGVRLDAFVSRGEKSANCTHLHDLALLAAAHAADDRPLVYDILVSDPLEGRREAELRRDGTRVLRWTVEGFLLLAPEDLAGASLDKLGPWISSLPPERQEEARLLRWGTMVANGRTIPLEQQSDARRMPKGNCYTFQPQRMAQAVRIGEIRDFSREGSEPLGGATH